MISTFVPSSTNVWEIFWAVKGDAAVNFIDFNFFFALDLTI